MRKSIMRVAAVALAATMTMGLATVAYGETFAEVDGSTVSIVGDRRLALDWDPANAALEMEEVASGIFQATFTVPEEFDNYGTVEAVEPGAYQFKFVVDGALMNWAYQFEYGTGNLKDNATQFAVEVEAGDELIYTVNVKTGEVIVVKNGEKADVTGQWDTRSEAETKEQEPLADIMTKYIAGEDTVYSVVGSPELAIQWNVENGEFFAHNNGDGTFTKTLVATADGDFEFKIVEDGPTFSWANQLQLGVSEFGDNKSQFKLPETEAGDVFEVTFNPTTGDVDVAKNGSDYEYLVRWATAAEDDEEFLTKTEALAKFVGDDEEESSSKEEESSSKEEESSSKEEESSSKEEATTAAPEATTAAPVATTTAKNAAPGTGDVAPIAALATLLGAAGVAAVVAKKKEA